MATFETSFLVRAPIQAVAEFHRDANALKRLTPPPLWVQFHRVDPLREQSVVEFTMWFGPFPVRWIALHSRVDLLRGFTDTQTRGPLKTWQHTHSFEPVDAQTTRVREHIELTYKPGLRHLWTKVFFSQLGLMFLFFYRARVTRKFVEGKE